MTDELAIEAIGLEKSYGAVRVLAGVDLRVSPGSVFALLGPNGAGKTTTVRILSTLIRQDGGQAREENLRMMARLSGIRARQARSSARDLLDRFGLTDVARRRVAAYSGGM